MKKNKNGKRYFELKHCIVFLTKRKRKREEGFFLVPTIWFSSCNFFKNDYKNVYFLPRAIEFAFLRWEFFICFDDKSFIEHL